MRAAGVDLDAVNAYLVATAQVPAGQGLRQASARVKVSLLRDPEAFGRAVQEWSQGQEAKT